jgi:site-specific DNA-methyltransferase (adenine-specific)
VMDFFAGSGTTGVACVELARQFILVDDNVAALRVMARRFSGVKDIVWVGFEPQDAGNG